MLHILVLLFGLNQTASAMEYENVKLVLYKKGESILGESFLPATEAVVDYIATLPRPETAFQGVKYDCMVKGTAVRNSVYQSGTSTSNAWVTSMIIYDIKGCAPSKPSPKP